MFTLYSVHEGNIQRVDIAVRTDCSTDDIIKELKLARIVRKSDKFKKYQFIPTEKGYSIKYKNEPRFRLERKH